MNKLTLMPSARQPNGWKIEKEKGISGRTALGFDFYRLVEHWQLLTVWAQSKVLNSDVLAAERNPEEFSATLYSRFHQYKKSFSFVASANAGQFTESLGYADLFLRLLEKSSGLHSHMNEAGEDVLCAAGAITLAAVLQRGGHSTAFRGYHGVYKDTNVEFGHVWLKAEPRDLSSEFELDPLRQNGTPTLREIALSTSQCGFLSRQFSPKAQVTSLFPPLD